MVLLVMLAGAACQTPVLSPGPAPPVADGAGESSSCRAIPHDLGETQICGTPQRLVALDTHSLDLLLALGVEPIGFAEDRRALIGTPQPGDAIVGVKYLGDRLTSRPTHIGISQSPSLETILMLQPDLILGRLWGDSQYPALSKIAPTLLPLAEDAPDYWRTRLKILGQALQQQEQAAAVLAEHDRQISQAQTNLDDYQGKSVLLLSMSGLEHIGIFDEDTFAGHLLEAVGLSLLVPSGEVPISSELMTSLEILPQLNPDFVIVMASGDSQVEQIQILWDEHPILRSHPAYQAHQVYFVDYQLWFVDYQLWSRINGPIAAELVLDEIQALLLPGD
jgi:iron complex transport system substrate-binding protein